MHPQSLERTEGTLHHFPWIFYDVLRRNAGDLVLAAGKMFGMEDEAKRILQPVCSLPLSSSSATVAEAGVTTNVSQWSPEGSPIPTVSLFLAASARLNNLLYPHKSGRATAAATAATAEALRDLPTLESLVVALKLMCWYCLATSRLDVVAAGDSFLRAGSGRCTPLQGRLHRPTTTINGNIIKTITTATTTTTTNNAGSSDVGAATDGESHDKDMQMAEDIFRLTVDVVVRLSTCGLSPRGCTIDGVVCKKELSADPLVEVRMMALYLLTAVLIRFKGMSFNAMRYLPTLFPEVDARDPHAMHPLLTPLLWDREERVQTAAAVLVSSLLRKLQQSFKYAEEPQQKRQSFSSLASQSGRTLALLHDAVLWALQLPRAATSSAAPHFSRGLILLVFGSLVNFTPYHRCPHASQVVQQALGLPVLRSFLLEDTSEEFASAAAFLGEVFKKDSLADVVRMFLPCGGRNTINLGKCDTVCSGDGACLLEALLTHAAKRVDVWRCVVQLSRLHPSIVGAHFARLIEASRNVLRASQEAYDNRDATISTRDSISMRGDTLGECLRAWLHFMGYVWQSFDGRPADPAFHQEHATHRATLQQKEKIMLELVIPSLLLTSSDSHFHDARQTALRCVAQVGDEHLLSLSQAVREKIVAQVVASTNSHESFVRAEAFTTLGVWAWKYSSLSGWMSDFVDCSVNALWSDMDAVVRFKAAFALSNITSHLGEDPDSSLLRQSPHHMQLLCDVAMQATEAHDPAVVGHGIRMMSHLLQRLSFEELIGELSGEQVGVAEGFLNSLLRFLQPCNYDAKLRWNAACALGAGFSREVVFEAEPRGAFQAVERLCVLVRHDRVFKVRTQAAIALTKVPMICLAAGRYSTTDLTPNVTRALCEALRASGGFTENFTQYREQSALCAALRNALTIFITSATPSDALQRVFAEFRSLLESEGLL